MYITFSAVCLEAFCPPVSRRNGLKGGKKAGGSRRPFELKLNVLIGKTEFVLAVMWESSMSICPIYT